MIRNNNFSRSPSRIRINESQLRKLVGRIIVENAAPGGGVGFHFGLKDNGLLEQGANIGGWWNRSFLIGSDKVIRELTKILGENTDFEDEALSVKEKAVFTFGSDQESFKITDNRAKAFLEELKLAVQDKVDLHAYIHVPLSGEAVKFLRNNEEYKKLANEMLKLKWLHTGGKL